MAEDPAHRVFDVLLGPDPGVAIDRPAPRTLPVLAHLDDALSSARVHGGASAALADALAAIAGHVTWMRRDEPERATPGFARGHANAVLVHSSRHGSHALMGVSLMAPNVRYPDHQHPPEEVYIVLSPGEWRNDRVDWFEPGIGNVVYNPPGIVHAMRSGDSPLLAIWLHVDRVVSTGRAGG